MIRTLKSKTAFSLLGCILWVQPAPAEEPKGEGAASSGSPGAESSEPAPTIEEAREAFLRGRSLMADGKWAEAEEKFLIAIRFKNTPGLRYYVGFCREKRGLLIEALKSYRMAEELLETQKAPDVDQIVPVAIERVGAQLPVLLLSDVPSGSRLKVDGAERPLSQQFPVDPGSHRVLIEKEGYSSFSATLDLKEGQKVRVQVVLEPLVAEVAPVEPEAETAGGTDPLRQIVFWSSSGIAAAGLGVGITGAVLFSATKKEVRELDAQAEEISGGGDSACSNPSPELKRVCDDLSRGTKRRNAMGNLMIGGFVGAGVGTAGALITHFFWPKAPVRVDVGVSVRETSVSATSVLLSGHF